MELARVASRKNPLVVRMRAVARGDDRTALLLDGPHLVSEALDARLSIRDAIVSTDAEPTAEVDHLVRRLADAGIQITTVSASVLAAVSPVRSPSPIVVTADRPRPDPLHIYDGPAPLVLLACGVQDPGNLGAIARAAEAAGATGLVAAGPCADPFSWKALRGSMGSALRLPIATVPDPIDAVLEARRHHCRLVGAVPQGGTPYFDLDFTGGIMVAVGSEGQGLPPDVAHHLDDRATIPMRAPVDSLNTAVTAALLVYEAARQRALHAGGRRPAQASR